MRYIFILMLFLCSLTVFAQKTKEDVYYQYEQIEQQIKKEELKFYTQKNWTIENKDQWGSFMWMVIRTEKIDANGDYWYYVYFYSNSFYNQQNNDGTYKKAITYITDLHVYMTEYNNDGRPLVVYDYYEPYITCDHNDKVDPDSYVAVFSSKFRYNKFDIKFAECTPFNESKY